MPLSEHEQRLLDEMERNLYGSRSDVHAAAASGRPPYRSVVLGVLTALVGVALLIVAVMTQMVLVGIAGFVVMFAGVLWATTSDRRKTNAEGSGPRPSTKKSRPSFIERMERRWDEGNDARL